MTDIAYERSVIELRFDKELMEHPRGFEPLTSVRYDSALPLSYGHPLFNIQNMKINWLVLRSSFEQSRTYQSQNQTKILLAKNQTQIPKSPDGNFCWRISTPRLNTLLCLHLVPINVIVSHGPYDDF